MKILDNLHAFLWLSPSANNCNTYLINADKKILVDPGHYHLFSHVQDGLSGLSLSPQDIDLVIITHGHPDHMEAVKVFANTSTLIAVSSIEMDFIKTVAPHYGDALGISDFEPDFLLQEGDLNVGEIEFQVIHTPGHSPGSICLFWPEKKVLFTGDVVFNQGIGRTDLPGGDGQELKESIKRISLRDAEYLLSGHGDILSGSEAVKNNFEGIERMWFPYL
ncbi:MAG: MBL fold metallo-hydrolase [Desulfobacteraceae bacterium]|nr:MAG: MBL fold metallo-hydrolase [Desulfobacteraceae bacterium]